VIARPSARAQRGFTLVELVLVMVLVGVVGSLGATFISRSVGMYRSTVVRAELTDQAVVALRRLSRELAAALPNSVRVTLADGRTFVSEPARARGIPENPLDDEVLRRKYLASAVPVLGAARAARIERAVHGLVTDRTALPTLLEELLQPVA